MGQLTSTPTKLAAKPANIIELTACCRTSAPIDILERILIPRTYVYGVGPQRAGIRRGKKSFFYG